ncbi:MAG: FitA-like ribbon-helix-helix domain-containing protein [Phycisphaerae bacterium]
MAQIIVRNLDDAIRDKLRARAKAHGRSMEEEVREIIRVAVIRKPKTEPRKGLGTRIAERFRGLGPMPPIPELRGFEARPAEFE